MYEHLWQTGATSEPFLFLSRCSTHSPSPKHNSKASSTLVQEWVDAPNFAIHPITAHYQKCTQGLARPCEWDGAHMHAHDVRTRPQGQTHVLTQVLSARTLNK